MVASDRLTPRRNVFQLGYVELGDLVSIVEFKLVRRFETSDFSSSKMTTWKKTR